MIVTFSKAVPELLVGRLIQALGVSSGYSLGGSVIADIYRLEERGTAMGICYGVSMAVMALIY